MENAPSYPLLLQVVLDTTDVRGLAEFYRQLLGFEYRRGDEPPAAGQPDERGQDWLVLRHPSSGQRIAFQGVSSLARSTWPEPDVPQQLHLDLEVPSMEVLQANYERALELGAKLLFDRSADPQEPLYVFADPAGHPFCIFVG